ncbi:muscarinic acetylcholine receptor M3-like [Lytechinus variegatus]|uniref:muscarinic acetylcholine receptor M3-like n=1 Tax=Lytechinus variegatus TaxID=7654 RepID=UPI001BB149FE|nr:muscarinic acetylcholine receptor M3-like [Lytechinus variegatus]
MENTCDIHQNTSSCCKDQDLYDISEHPMHSIAWLATVPLTLSIIIAVTIVGNAMVIAAYFRDKRIRNNVANILILNLAITDFVVGAFIISINTAWIIKDVWTYGEVFCKIWIDVDFVVTMMSTLTMVLISWDRYCLLTMGMRYKTFQTKKRICVILAISWTIHILIYTFLAFGWSPITGEYNVDYSQNCEMEFTYNVAATIVINISGFFIPFVILIILNIAVYSNIKRRSRGTVGQNPSSSINTSARSPKKIFGPRSPGRVNYRHPDGPSVPVAVSPSRGDNGVAAKVTTESTDNRACFSGEKPLTRELSIERTSTSKKEGRTFARHRKAAFVLAILIGCFLLCWLPYQVTSVMYAVCDTDCVSTRLWEVTNLLLWCNSTINPFIYAATNVHFRRNFRTFLLLDRWACDFKNCELKCQNANQIQVATESLNGSTVT